MYPRPFFFILIDQRDGNVGEKMTMKEKKKKRKIHLIMFDLTSISFFNDERLSCSQSAHVAAEGADADTATAECFITSELRLNSMALLA